MVLPLVIICLAEDWFLTVFGYIGISVYPLYLSMEYCKEINMTLQEGRFVVERSLSIAVFYYIALLVLAYHIYCIKEELFLE